MTFRVVIPARYGSVRLPGKALLTIAGKPLLQWVHERAVASGASEVWIATDDERIERVALHFGAKVVMTRSEHASGTDRIAEVALARAWEPNSIVVNVQGDEPLMPPRVIDQVAHLLRDDPAAQMATLAAPLRRRADLADRNVVKLVSSKNGYALYFSRAAIPCDRDAALERGRADGGSTQTSIGHHPERELLAIARRHLGIYAYRVVALKQLTATAPTALESLEKLEQLRALEIGLSIRVADAIEVPLADVNTREDRVAAERLLLSR